MSLQKKQPAILNLLKQYYPSIQIALHFSNTWELLVATMLSAQCTDKRVNLTTKQLFQKYTSIADYAFSDLSQLENMIRSVGMFRTKSRNIQKSAQKILTDYKGRVPNQMKNLLTLPGVGRKTANVVLFNGFQKNEGIAVDTHVQRISKILGLSQSTKPDSIEKDLMKSYPSKEWGNLNHRLVQYGRDICVARRPRCSQCILIDYCDDYQNRRQ